MIQRQLVVTQLLVLLLRTAAAAASAVETLPLSEALKLSLQNNLDLKITASQELERSALVTQALGEFDVSLDLGATIDRNITPSASSLDGVAADLKTKDQIHSATLKKKFGWGTELQLPYSYTIGESNSSYRRFSTSHKTSLALKGSQPLLKLLSPGYFTQALTRAEIDWKIAQREHGAKILATVSKTIQLYWETLKAQETLSIRRSAFESSRANEEFVVEKHRLGRSGLLEKLEAESATQKQKEALLRAENSLAEKQGQFALHVLADPAAPFLLSDRLDELPLFEEVTDPHLIVQEALKTRVEARKAADLVEKAEIELRGARVDRLPGLSVDADYTKSGLSSSLSQSHDDMIQAGHDSWTLSLRADQPVFMYAKRGAHRIKELRLEQELLKQKQTERDISLEVRKHLRDLRIGWQRVLALTKAVDAETERYEGEEARYRLGQVSAFELNQALEAKLQAATDLLDAKISYLVARNKLSESRGTLLTELGLAAKSQESDL